MRFIFLVCCSLSGLGAANAEVVQSQSDFYVLEQKATSSLTPEEVWNRLVNPAEWWHPDHTFSGDATNLKLDAQAGGLWREDWDGGSVAHGEILAVIPGRQLRLSAPFGPLQGMAVNVVWTIKVEPHENGSLVSFHEIAAGNGNSKLDETAVGVDFVKTEAIKRLTKSK